jgi:hypothetical protein
VAGVKTDGREYVGPSGGWVEFGDEDAPIMASISEWMAEYLGRHIDTFLRALGDGGPAAEHDGAAGGAP